MTSKLGLLYAWFRANSFGEHDAGGQNLNVGSDKINSLPPSPGVAPHPRKNLDIAVSHDTLINTSGASAHQGSLNVAYRF